MRVPHWGLPRRIEWQLPLSIAGLLLVVAGSLIWLATREVRRTAFEGAGDRLRTVGRQLATLYGQGIQVRLAETRAVAADTTVVAALAAGSSADRVARGRQRLQQLLEANDLIAAVELWGVSGEPVARVSRGAAPGDSGWVGPGFPEWAQADTAPVIGGIRGRGDRAWLEVAAPVRRDGRSLGFVVQSRWLSSSPYATRVFVDLIGEEAQLRLGVPGQAWTDLYGLAPGPPDAAELGPAEYRTDDGVAYVGAGQPVPGSPLVLWVAFPGAQVFARARSFARGMMPLGLGIVLVGALGGWGLSRRLTRPLRRLRRATTAFAAGDLSQQVPVGGPVELRELAETFNTMARRIEAAHQTLEQQVTERTAELRAANQELEAFSYSVSHDLRAPLRSIHGFSQALLEDYAGRLDAEGADHLRRVCAAADRMGALIDDLLALSRVTRSEMRKETVDLTAIARGILDDFQGAAPARRLETTVQDGLTASGDQRLLRQALENLLDNAWKFSSKAEQVTIEVGARDGAEPAFYVRDNGAGFDMAYADKLFGVFQRLHSPSEFPGTGVGLAIVQRVVHRHGGRVWAEGAPGRGATFYFTLAAD